MEDIDGGLHPAVDGQSLDEMRDLCNTQLGFFFMSLCDPYEHHIDLFNESCLSVDSKWEMSVKKSIKYGEYGSFEHLLFFFCHQYIA